jgi:hypothetical protein
MCQDFFDKENRYSMKKTNKFTGIEAVRDRIFEKHSNAAENEKLYKFIVGILKMNPLERPSPFDLKKHAYLMDSGEEIKENLISKKVEYDEIEVRDQPNPIPVEGFIRRNSVHDFTPLMKNQKSVKNTRKYSVFNITHDFDNDK